MLSHWIPKRVWSRRRSWPLGLNVSQCTVARLRLRSCSCSFLFVVVLFAHLIALEMLSLANQRKVFRLAASVRQLSGPPIVANPSLKRVEIINEPLLGYMKGSEERATLDRELQHRLSVVEEVPLVIAGREHWSDDIRYQTMVRHPKRGLPRALNWCWFIMQPHDHGRVLAKFCYANKVSCKTNILWIKLKFGGVTHKRLTIIPAV